MILLANILEALATLVNLAKNLLTFYSYIIIASVIISWVSADPYNPLVNFIHRVTEPVLRRIRRHMPDTGAIDLSPMVAFVAIIILQKIVFNTVSEYLIRAGMALKLGHWPL